MPRNGLRGSLIGDGYSELSFLRAVANTGMLDGATDTPSANTAAINW